MIMDLPEIKDAVSVRGKILRAHIDARDDACFATLRIPDNGLSELARSVMRKKNIRGQISDTDRFHITLAYFESITDDQINALNSKLSLPIKFSLEAARLGVLNGGDLPVLVLHVDPGPALVRLQSEIYHTALGLGAVPGERGYSDPKNWHPHISLIYDMSNIVPEDQLPEIEPFHFIPNEFYYSRGDYQSVLTVKLPQSTGDHPMVEKKWVSRGSVGSSVSSNPDAAACTMVTKDQFDALLRGDTVVYGLMRRSITMDDGPFVIRKKATAVEVDPEVQEENVEPKPCVKRVESVIDEQPVKRIIQRIHSEVTSHPESENSHGLIESVRRSLSDFVDTVFGVARGGKGSGNFGHKGRPGEVGGSDEGGSKKRIGITSARPGKPSGQVFDDMRDFQSRLEEIGTITDARVQPGLGGWEGGSEPTWVVEYTGNGDAIKLLQETAGQFDQDAVLVMEEGDNSVYVDFSFTDPVTPSERQSVEQALADQGIGGWTWFKAPGANSVLRAVAVPQWGGDKESHLVSAEQLRDVFDQAGMPHEFVSGDINVGIMDREGNYELEYE